MLFISKGVALGSVIDVIYNANVLLAKGTILEKSHFSLLHEMAKVKWV